MPSSATASRARSSKPLKTAARVGYAVNGLLHLLIGGIAVSVAIGGGGQADQNGALGALASNPVGLVSLWITVVGLLGLGVLELVTAASGGETKERVKHAGKGVAYLVVAATALRFAVGSGSSGDATESVSATLLANPLGVVLLVIVGLGVGAIGVYLVAKGIRQKFRDDVAVPGGALGTVLVATGVAGYVAKGVAIVIVGVLFVVAAFSHDAKQAGGLDQALKTLAELPFGVVILIVVALGLIAFGVYSFFRARFARL